MGDLATTEPVQALTPDQTEPPCPTRGAGASPSGLTPVYVIGRIEARFPRLAIEKEFAQATGRGDLVGKTDRQAFHEVLADRGNRYLLRKMCWVMSVQELETYLLQPREAADLDLLLAAIRPRPGPLDLDVVIGMRGPIAPP